MRTLGLALLTLAYPVLVYFGLGHHIEPRWLALLLVAMALMRAAFGRERVWLVAACGAVGAGGIELLGQPGHAAQVVPGAGECDLAVRICVQPCVPPPPSLSAWRACKSRTCRRKALPIPGV